MFRGDSIWFSYQFLCLLPSKTFITFSILFWTTSWDYLGSINFELLWVFPLGKCKNNIFVYLLINCSGGCLNIVFLLIFMSTSIKVFCRSSIAGFYVCVWCQVLPVYNFWTYISFPSLEIQNFNNVAVSLLIKYSGGCLNMVFLSICMSTSF